MRSVLHPLRRLTYALAVLAVLLPFATRPVFATSTGIAGYSGTQQGTTCNVCHSLGSTPTVSLTGPSALDPNAVGTYMFTVQSTSSHQTAAGFNVAASGGTLQVVNGQKEQIFPGTSELTQRTEGEQRQRSGNVGVQVEGAGDSRKLFPVRGWQQRQPQRHHRW